MILMGKPMPVPVAKKNGIIDKVAEGNLLDEAAAFALASKPFPVSKRKVPNLSKLASMSGAFGQARDMAAAQAPGMIAPMGIIKCLEAACEPISFEEGLK